MKKGFAVLCLVVAVAMIMGSYSPVFANSAVSDKNQGQEVCPNGDGWDKVDGLSGSSYTYTAPEGKEIVAWCYKASTEVVKGDVVPPAGSYTVTSTILVDPDDPSKGVHDLSHASFKLQDKVVPVKNTASLDVVNNCTSWEIVVNASAGASVPSLPRGTWSNPYASESAPGGSVTVTWASGEPLSITLPYDTINKLESCIVTLPHKYEVVYDSSCDGYSWAVTVDKGTFVSDIPLSGTWVDKYTQERTLVLPTITVTWDDGFVDSFKLGEIVEPANCLVVDGHEFSVTPDSDCDGYSWSVNVVNGTFEVLDGASLSGVWTKKYDPEKSPNPVVKMTWTDGYTKNVTMDTIVEPKTCVPDRPTPEPTPVPNTTPSTGAGSDLPWWVWPMRLTGFGLGLIALALLFKKN